MWSQTLAGGKLNRHNATLNAANVNRIFAGTAISTVEQLLSDCGTTVEAWADSQLVGTDRSAKTVKNYLSATLSFMEYLQVKGYRATSRVRVAVGCVQRDLHRDVKEIRNNKGYNTHRQHPHLNAPHRTRCNGCDLVFDPTL